MTWNPSKDIRRFWNNTLPQGALPQGAFPVYVHQDSTTAILPTIIPQVELKSSGRLTGGNARIDIANGL